MEKHLFVGIDVSADWVDVACIHQTKKSPEMVGRYDNNEWGFANLVRQLEKRYDLPKNHWFVGFENTGRYSKPLRQFLDQYGYDYAEESGSQIRASRGLERGDNDQQSAQAIARYFYHRRDELKKDKPLDELIQGLRDLLAYRKRLLKVKHILEVAQKGLKDFPLYEKTQLIIELSKDSTHPINQKLDQVDKLIVSYINQRKALKKNYQLATSVKGIGPVIAATMLAYTHNFTRFDTWRQFAAYIATAPFSKGSGKQVGTTRVTKIGCKDLKTLLTQGVRSAMIWDPQIKAFAKRKLEEGKNYKNVRNAVRNKLIARVFAVVKQGEPYKVLQY